MKLLAIDTSTEQATVAIALDSEIHGEEQGSMRQHAQLLLPMVERLLAKAGLSFSQLDGVIFGRGPGSFTGLRIACSVAKGLAFAHDLPLYPVSSLSAIAFEVSQTSDLPILAMIDARMHQVYWGYFPHKCTSVLEQVTSAADIVLPSADPFILAGVGFDSYALHLSNTIQSLIIKKCSIFPNAKAMIGMVQSGQIKAVSAAEALPVYIRDKVTQGEARG